MSFGANSILDMGRWALFASQVQLQVTGENISNVNTEGYSRRSAVLEEGPYIDYSPGQLGTGVKAKEVVRNFDEMVEAMYVGQATMRDKWGTLWESAQGRGEPAQRVERHRHQQFVVPVFQFLE